VVPINARMRGLGKELGGSSRVWPLILDPGGWVLSLVLREWSDGNVACLYCLGFR
jgi:hypothetical protein